MNHFKDLSHLFWFWGAEQGGFVWRGLGVQPEYMENIEEGISKYALERRTVDGLTVRLLAITRPEIGDIDSRITLSPLF